MQNVQQTTVNALRVLSIEGVEKANSGHPGLPLGSAPITYALFQNHMIFNPRNPKFDNRDRFILSAGHGSMLNYATLHLYGYAVSKEDLMSFRQFGSKCAGHPEYRLTPGIETTTGPLGQGVANAVGMAIAENYLATKFNKEGFPIVDHYTYALTGDGCMQEGIENEAASLAGTLKLGKLIVFYDDNDITIEGNTDIAFREDVGKRHEALGWQVINVKDINDINALNKAVKKAKACTDKPSLIICKSVIGYGSPMEGNPHCHGAPLGAENVQKTKEILGYNAEPFEVPEEVKKHTAKAIRKGKRAEKAWKELFKAYEVAYPELAKEYKAWMANEKPDLINNEELWKFDKKDATRNTSFTVLNRLADLIPNLIGGSADLAPSNKSNMKNRGDFLPDDKTGSNMHFGIREHAMAAIANGMCVHGGLTTYCSTFFVFSDYMKNAIRLSALMGLPVTYVLTHDSIGVGEDGPTHQPVEHLVGLRSIPNIKVYRPADGKETTAAWISALTGTEPTLLVLTRQNLPQYENSGVEALKGGYILADSEKATPDVLLIASGSEVELCMEAKKVLKEQGVDARVVSMPCIEVFNKQPKKYRESVIPNKVRARVCVEAATPYSWHQFAGLDGEIIAMNTFGESAPAELLFKHFGFTVENVVEKALKTMNK